MTQCSLNAMIADILKKLECTFVSQADTKAFLDKEPIISHFDQVICSFNDSKSLQSSINELEIANELCMHCARQKTDYFRYRVFDALFSMTRKSARMTRRQILCLTASLAIALKSTPVLECVGLWLATAPVEHAIFLVSSLEKDFCVVMPDSLPELRCANATCEKFCVMLVSALCIIYNSDDCLTRSSNAKVFLKYPPTILLEIIQQWILVNPRFIFKVIFQMDQVWHTVLTTTRNPSECLPLCPLAGLIRWSVTLPFAPMKCIVEEVPYLSFSYRNCQSRLHYGILRSMTLSKECRIAIEQGILGKESDFELWSKADAHVLVGYLIYRGLSKQDSESVTQAVDRFAQISQVAMTYNLLVIAKEQFQSLIDPLPQTKLLELVAYGTEKPIEDINEV